MFTFCAITIVLDYNLFTEDQLSVASRHSICSNRMEKYANPSLEPAMTVSFPVDSGPSTDQNARIIEMIFLASDLAHSCEALDYDQNGVTKELVKCVNRSVALLKRLLAENERETTEGVSASRARLFAIPGGIE